jgi:hypothetical protein
MFNSPYTINAKKIDFFLRVIEARTTNNSLCILYRGMSARGIGAIADVGGDYKQHWCGVVCWVNTIKRPEPTSTRVQLVRVGENGTIPVCVINPQPKHWKGTEQGQLSHMLNRMMKTWRPQWLHFANMDAIHHCNAIRDCNI